MTRCLGVLTLAPGSALPSCVTVHDSDLLRVLTTRADWKGRLLSDMTWIEARDMLVDVVHSLARHGPRRFYVLNTGVSTANSFAAEGITIACTDIIAAGKAACAEVEQQPEGTHADEIETLMMLFIATRTVDMFEAGKDFPHGAGPMTPDPSKGERCSPSGIYGDATLATREKGEKVVDCTLKSILADIDALRASPLPAAQP